LRIAGDGALLWRIGNRDFWFTRSPSVTEVLSRCARLTRPHGLR